MTGRTLNLVVLLESQRSRMTARHTQLPLLATFALIGLTAVAVFAPLAAATGNARERAAEAAAQDDARHQALSSMVAEQDAAARRAIESAREVVKTNQTVTTGDLLTDVRRPAARPGRTVRMLVTAYCPCTKCCGPSAQGITASGKKVSYNQGRFVAADKTLLPFGTRLQVPGYHDAATVEVTDTGSAIRGHRLDVYYHSHQKALEWGKRWVDVVVLD